MTQYAKNWRLMYCERRRIDRSALELLRDITLFRTNRNDKAVILTTMGPDVWDVLDIERTFLPSIRSPSPELPYALTQHFWAQRILETMARRETIDVWATLLPDADVATDDRASFEQTMLGLSSFLGHSMHDVSDWVVFELRAWS
jgi:F-box protein 21